MKQKKAINSSWRSFTWIEWWSGCWQQLYKSNKSNARTKCPVQIRTQDENLFPIQKLCVFLSIFLFFCQWPFFRSLEIYKHTEHTQKKNRKKDFIIYAQKRSFFLCFFYMLLLPPKAKAHIEQQQQAHEKKCTQKKHDTHTWNINVYDLKQWFQRFFSFSFSCNNKVDGKDDGGKR